MELASNLWFFLVGVVSLILYLTWLASKRTSLPPGPPRWPIVGSLFYLSKLPHRSMEELAKKYGPIMYLRLGYLNHIVISNAEMAREVLKTHDAAFASRPTSTAGKYAGLDYSDIIFAQYGDHWRLLRKICATELFTQARLNTFATARHDEVACMVQSLYNHGGKIVEIRPTFHQLTSNQICRMLFGKRREKSDGLIGNEFDDFFNCISEMVEVVGRFNVGDLMPALRPFDLQGLERQMKRIRTRMETQLSNILNEYKKGTKVVVDSTIKDFVEILMGLNDKLDEKSIMAVLVDMLGGGTDTSATTLEWALTELIHHPEIMNRAQEELERVVGENRPVLESDLPNLHYLQAIVKENFRLHPVVPLTIPHFNNTDTQILNYNIPANSNVLVSIWAIGRDPKTWDKPLEFNPDRFLHSDINVLGSNYTILPFGSGRRGCPGLNLAQLMVQCSLAAILHAFDWSPQPGVKPEDMNLMEAFGAACPTAEPLVALAKPRLSAQVYKRLM